MKNLTILIVEDEPVTRDMIALKLTKEGYTVESAPSGVEAIEIISRTFYDVIITDLMMPGGIDGIGVLEAAKARSSRTEVLLLTAHATVQNAVEAMRKGATNYLQKPVNFYELLVQLDKISSFKRMALNSEEMREALEVTEQNAARVIQDLEMEVSQLRSLLNEAGQTLSKGNLDAARRIEMARKLLDGV